MSPKNSQKLNVLIIKNPINSQGFGGGEVHTMQIAEHLREKGHSVYFAGTCKDLLDKARSEGFETYKTDFGGVEAVDKMSALKFIFTWPFIYFAYKKFLLKLKKEKNINTLYLISWNEKFLLAPLANKLGIKTFFVEHRLMGNFIYLNPFRFFYVNSSKFAKIIAVSKEVKRGIVKLGVKENRIEVVYNGIDTDKFESVHEKLFEKRKDEIVIGSIGRLSAEKGFKYLLSGFRIANEKMPNLRLKIVGRGPEKENIVALINSKNIKNVTLLGAMEGNDILKFLNSIDIFSLTSTNESFGIVFAEAGIMGKPSIGTDVGGIPEVVENNETGILIKPENEAEVASAILKLASDPKLIIKMGENAKSRIENNFSLSLMLEKIEKIFLK